MNLQKIFRIYEGIMKVNPVERLFKYEPDEPVLRYFAQDPVVNRGIYSLLVATANLPKFAK